MAAVRALLDAGALATTGMPVDPSGGLGLLVRGLDDLSAGLASEGPGATLLVAVLDALDSEIGRWEERARNDDTEARAILRAYLGLREILWEMGVRRPTPDRPASRPAASRPAPRSRVQRVTVED